MAEAKLKVTYNAAKLVKALPRIIEDLSSGMADRAKDFLRKNTLRGKDINGDNFEPLSEVTKNMRKNGFGTYKTPISHDRPLIASKKMVNSITRVFNTSDATHGLELRGYGVYHNKEQVNSKGGRVPKREWFGVSNNVFKNIVDNKKIKLFRRQIARAFKK